MKVLYKSNLICELIGVGKPGQWHGGNGGSVGFLVHLSQRDPPPFGSCFCGLRGKRLQRHLCAKTLASYWSRFILIQPQTASCVAQQPNPSFSHLGKPLSDLEPHRRARRALWELMAVVLCLQSVGCWMFPPYCIL